MPKAARAEAAFVKRYPRTVNAGKDRPIELRLMDRGDMSRMVDFATALPPDGLLFLRRSITDTGELEARFDNIESSQTVVVLALADARATFERLGFRPEALRTDWVMDAKGLTPDLLVMAYDLEGLTDTVEA